MKRISKEERARAHLCTFPGCNRPWTSNFTGWRVCGEHAARPKPAVPIPSTSPQPHWLDELEERPDGIA